MRPPPSCTSSTCETVARANDGYCTIATWPVSCVRARTVRTRTSSRSPGPSEERRDRRALRGREGPDLGEVIDEDPIALVGGNAAGGGVRRGDELFVLEQRHVVADRGGRHTEGVPLDDRLAADGFACVDEVLHDRPQNLQSSIGDHLASSQPAGTHIF